MLAETRQSKMRDMRDNVTKENRVNFIESIEQGVKIAVAGRECNVLPTTARRLASAFKNRVDDPEALQRLLNPHENRAGRRFVITKEEQGMTVEKIERAEMRGASVGIDQVKQLFADISNDGRSGFKKGVPSDATIRKFRSENRELTVRTYRPKDIAKVKAESYTHVQSFKTVLEHIEKDYNGIFSRGETVWNFDETCVNSDRSRKEKVLSSTRLHGGANVSRASRVSGTGSGGKHVTDVVAISAAGDLSELFLIIEGEYKMTGWFKALDIPAADVKVVSGGVDLRPYCEEGWFPNNACVQMQKKGSMTKELMRVFLQHLRVQIDTKHPQLNGQPVAVLTDGHSSRSRSDVTWIEEAQKKNMVIALSPANTTHFLQACDHLVNKSLSHWVTATKEAMLANGIIAVHSVQAKLIMAVESHRRLARSDVVKSWEDIGLFPMDYRFLKLFQEKFGVAAAESTTRDNVPRLEGNEEGLGNENCENRRPRKSDEAITKEIEDILANTETPAARKLQSIAVKLQQESCTNSILQSVMSIPQRQVSTPGASAATGSRGEASARMSDGQATRENGTPAQYMTHSESVQRFKEEARKKEAERLEKERKKEARRQENEHAKIRRQQEAVKRAQAAAKREQEKTNRKRALEQKRAETQARRQSKTPRKKRATTASEASTFASTTGSASNPIITSASGSALHASNVESTAVRADFETPTLPTSLPRQFLPPMYPA